MGKLRYREGKQLVQAQLAAESGIEVRSPESQSAALSLKLSFPLTPEHGDRGSRQVRTGAGRVWGEEFYPAAARAAMHYSLL